MPRLLRPQHETVRQDPADGKPPSLPQDIVTIFEDNDAAVDLEEALERREEK